MSDLISLSENNTRCRSVCVSIHESQSQKQKSPSRWMGFLRILVAWGGIEPPTRGFSKHPTPVDWLCVRGRSVTVFRVFPSAALALTELAAELVRPSALHDHQIFPTGSTSLMIRTPNRTTEPHGHRVSWPCPPCRLSRAQIGQLHDRAHTAGDFFGRWGTDLGHPSSHGRRRCLGLCRHLL